jgi:hypothetical protein
MDCKWLVNDRLFISPSAIKLQGIVFWYGFL